MVIALLATLVISPLGQQNPAEKPIGPEPGPIVQKFRIFVNSHANYPSSGLCRDNYDSLRPHGFLTVRVDQGGRRRSFEMEMGARQEFFGDVPHTERFGQSSPFAFTRLISDDDEKGLLEKAHVTEDFRVFESGMDLPYYARFDKPIQAFQTLVDLSRGKEGYEVVVATQEPGHVVPGRKYRVRISKEVRIWSEAVEPFMADRAWVRKAMADAKENKRTTYLVTGRAGEVVPLALHISGSESVTFAGWTKELVRIDLEHLNTNIKSKKYAGTSWVEADGTFQLAAVEVGGLLNLGGFVARETNEFDRATFWRCFRYDRRIVGRKSLAPGATSRASKG